MNIPQTITSPIINSKYQPQIHSEETNQRATDRVLSLAVIDDKVAKTTRGTVDSRLFTGEQTLHVKMDPHSSLWSFQYGHGNILPGGLEGVFTSFSKAYSHAETYFKKRNVKITEVKD